MTKNQIKIEQTNVAAFREAMASMAASVCVVAVQHEGERLGRTITSVLSLSAHPPRILISIDRKSRLIEKIFQTHCFSFFVLSCGQENVADAFAGRLEPVRRFDIGGWRNGRSGQPFLPQSTVAAECSVHDFISLGDHVLVAGNITALELDLARMPLLWYQRQYSVPHKANTTRLS